MKYLRITLTVFALLTLLLASACTGGGSSSGSSSGSQTSGQSSEPDETEESDEPEIFDFSGTDPGELLETWENMGEDPDVLEASLTNVSPLLLEEDGVYVQLIEWHITEIAEGNRDEYRIELDEGGYILYGISGAGIVGINAVAYGEDDEELDIDDWVSPLVMLFLWPDEDQEVEVIFDPEFEEGAESALYCWFIFSTQNIDLANY